MVVKILDMLQNMLSPCRHDTGRLYTEQKYEIGLPQLVVCCSLHIVTVFSHKLSHKIIL